MEAPSRAIADIRIGKRVRQTYGDIEALAASIQERGLLQPVGIRPDNTLVCGERRIRAFKQLKRTEIPVYVCEGLEDELRYLEAERDENTCRQGLTPVEAREQQQRLEPLYAQQGKAEQKKSPGRPTSPPKKGGETSTTFSEPRDNTKRTAHRAAASTGYSDKTLKKVAEIQQAAKKQPKLYGNLVDALNEPDCKVDRIHKKYKAIKKQQEDLAAAKKAAKEVAKTDDNGIFLADFRNGCKVIPDSSVALIFTDPPYDRKSLPLFAALADLADRVLVDGGSLVTFCGQYVLNDVMDMLSAKLRYFWICCCQHTGATAEMKEYGVKVKWKPMLWFVKGNFRRNREEWVEDLVVSKQEKDQHEWQQSVIEATYFIDRLTVKGEMVLDPFCGGGTTAFSAKQLGRKWATFDTDPKAVATARGRLQT